MLVDNDQEREVEEAKGETGLGKMSLDGKSALWPLIDVSSSCSAGGDAAIFKP